jgi:hypothetical protein
MAKSKRLSPNQLADVKSNFAGLKQIAGYSPINGEFKVSEIEPIETELDNLLLQEAQIDAQLKDVRDRIANKSNEFVQKMNGAAQQVIAQFGDDSGELQAIGRKRKSDRAVGRRKGKAVK